MNFAKSQLAQRSSLFVIAALSCFTTLAAISWFLSREFGLLANLALLFAAISVLVGAAMLLWHRVPGYVAAAAGSACGAAAAMGLATMASI